VGKLTNQVPWLRVSVEGFVIVVSILLAFGIEAWWDGVQQRQREQLYLVQLHEDLAGAASMLESTLRWSENSVRAIERIVPLFAQGRMPDADTASFVADLYQASRLYTTAAGTSVFEDLDSGDDISLIGDPALRRSLSSLVASSSSYLRTFSNSLPGDYRIAVRRALPARLQSELLSTCPILPAEPLPCRGVEREDYADLLNSLSGRSDLVGPLNHLAAQYLTGQTNVLGFLEATRDLRAALETHIAR
jgi:hypothetical protein